MSDFDWSKSANVVLRSYGDIAIYTNDSNDLVIRQRSYPDEDAVVVIPEGQVELIILAIRDIVGLKL